MRKNAAHPWAIAVVCALPATAAAGPSAKSAETAEALTFGAPIHYHNMTIVPVTTSKTGPFTRYVLLEEGLKRKTLRVRELNGQSSDARVSEVEVRNRGEYAVFLLGGEMILGGKQDRIIQSDAGVPNDGKWHKVAVFCVEQGRWASRNMKFSAGSAIAHVGLRKAALSGDQSKVWAEVSRKNSEHGTSNPTQTYRRTVQNAKLRKRIKRYRKQIERMLPVSRRLAGFVFAINGKIRIADLFGNPLLFHDLQEKLLSAYILEALEVSVDKAAPKLRSPAAAQYLNGRRKTTRGKKKQKGKKSGRATTFKSSAGGLGTRSVDDATGETVRETYVAE